MKNEFGDESETVGRGLLIDTVKIMYEGWCLDPVVDYPAAAKERAREYVYQIFDRFVSSLPTDGNDISLVPPPPTWPENYGDVNHH